MRASTAGRPSRRRSTERSIISTTSRSSWTTRTVFAWLGVTMYLTRAAIEGTWRAMRSVAACGSDLVFDFIHPAALSETAPPPARKVQKRVRAVGEPIITGLDPTALAAELAATGWTLVEQLDAAEIDQRYFAMRSDGYRARQLGHLACTAAA